MIRTFGLVMMRTEISTMKKSKKCLLMMREDMKLMILRDMMSIGQLIFLRAH
jgi:hypothetical protein